MGISQNPISSDCDLWPSFFELSDLSQLEEEISKEASDNLVNTTNLGPIHSELEIKHNNDHVLNLASGGIIQEDETEDLHPQDLTDQDEITSGNESLDSENSEFDPIGFGDFGKYFNNKLKKQQNKDDQTKKIDLMMLKRRVENQGSKFTKKTLKDLRPQIFKGVSIYVNGYTNPSIQELHRLVVIYGGVFISYLSKKTSVTHIIASRLTPKKRIEFSKYKVVKPEWITKSIESKTLLSWLDFKLIDNDISQDRLDTLIHKSKLIHKPINNVRSKTTNNDVFTQNGSRKYNNQALIRGGAEEVLISSLGSGSGPDDSNRLEENLVDVNDSNDIGKNPILDCTDPQFIKNYFARSRLHHLSNWKSELKTQFQQLALKKYKSSQSQLQNHNNFSTVKHRVIFHIDFDCFFATVSSFSRPDLNPKIIPICVSNGTKNSDIASCNYVAREFGVKNGMWVSKAKQLCPQLVCLDYEFNDYEKASKQFYNILLDLDADSVFPVSIDEALVDVTSLCNEEINYEYTDDVDEDDELFQISRQFEMKVSLLAKNIRSKVKSITKCDVSIGAGPNILLAKLALKRAKPNGQISMFQSSEIKKHLEQLSVQDLPGSGRSIKQRLIEVFKKNTGSTTFTVGELKSIEKNRLITEFGNKTGLKLWEYARGIDDTKTPNILDRKSVSCDVNWGVRFTTMEQIDIFLTNLAKELSERLNKLSLIGSHLTLRLFKRKQNISYETPKYLGHGECDIFSKSSRLGVATNEWRIISSESKSLIRMLACPPKELRGIGLHISKLNDVNSNDLAKGQKKLNFKVAQPPDTNTTITFPISKVPKIPKIPTVPKVLKPLKHLHPTSHEEDSIPGTQYEIPNVIDESVLNELPSSIQNKIRKGVEKSKSVTNSPHSNSLIAQPISNNNSVIPFPDLSAIDWSVFDELPNDIKQELEKQYRQIAPRPSTSDSASINIDRMGNRKQKKDSPGKTIYFQQLISAKGDIPEVVRVVSPAHKRRKLGTNSKNNSPSKNRIQSGPGVFPIAKQKDLDYDLNINESEELLKLDLDTLNELPPTLRAEILKDWQSHEQEQLRLYNTNKNQKNQKAESIKDVLNGNRTNDETSKGFKGPSKNLEYLSTQVRKIYEKKDEPIDITIEEYTSYKGLQEPVSFQGLTNIDEIQKLVEQWFESSMKDENDGPEKSDTDMFLSYLNRLLNDSDNKGEDTEDEDDYDQIGLGNAIQLTQFLMTLHNCESRGIERHSQYDGEVLIDEVLKLRNWNKIISFMKEMILNYCKKHLIICNISID